MHKSVKFGMAKEIWDIIKLDLCADKELNSEKLALHNMIMQTDNKDLNKLEHSTYETMLKKLKLKDKSFVQKLKQLLIKPEEILCTKDNDGDSDHNI